MTENPRNSEANSHVGYPIPVLVVTAIVLLGAILARLLENPDFINHDCAFQLSTAKLLMEGKQPFKDFVDMAPPVLFYLRTLPWFLAKVIPLKIQLIWSLINWTAMVYSAVAAGIVIHQARSDNPKDCPSLGCLYAGFLLLQLTLTFHLGQREHLFLLFYWPVFLIRWQRWQGQSPNHIIAVISGILCAFELSTKPQLLAIPIFQEIFFWFTRKDYRSLKLLRAGELTACGITVVAITALSLLVPHMDEYFSRWVPLIAQGYSFYNVEIPRLLWFSTGDGSLIASRLLFAVVCICGFAYRKHSSLSMPLLLFTLVGWCLYVQQGKGWGYHTIPMVFGYFLLACLQLSLLAQEILPRLVKLINRFVTRQADSQSQNEYLQPANYAITILLVFSLLFMPVSVLIVRDSMTTGKVTKRLDELIENNSNPGDPVLILNTNFITAYPLLLNLDRKPASRFLWMFPLDMTFSMKARAKSDYEWRKYDVEEAKIVNELVQDIQRVKPRVIAIEATKPREIMSLYRRLTDRNFLYRALGDYEPYGECNGYAVWVLKKQESSDPPPLNTPEPPKASWSARRAL